MLTVHSILLVVISAYLQLLCISKEYYNQSGYQFLREYGQHYNLFSTFLSDNGTSSIIHSSTGSILESIHHRYKIRDYANYSTWEHISFADRNIFSDDADSGKGYYATRSGSEFIPDKDLAAAYYHNNRLRFGPSFADRFLSIVFHKDPWVDPDATVNFIGDGRYLGGHAKEAWCHFTYPVQASSKYRIIKYLRLCPIPDEVLSNLTAEHTEIVFDLASPDGVMLKNVRVKRLHQLDRRVFNVSMALFTDSLDHHMLFEFVVYHLMMGVEHFYVFDNRRIYPVVNESAHYSAKYWGLKDCILRPFLDANLITLVHFPFAPDRVRGAINSIQNYHFGVLMQQFGHYNKYIGIFDYDEFFLPSKNFHHLLTMRPHDQPRQAGEESFIYNVLRALDDQRSPQRLPQHMHGTIDGINFNTVDMGCDDSDAMEVATVSSNKYVQARKRHGSITRAAVTHCNREGVLFLEFALLNGTFASKGAIHLPSQYLGRGKAFWKPELNLHPQTPHYTNSPLLGTEENGGTIS